MLLPVVFLPLAAVLISDAKTDLSNRAITVDIATSEPVMREDVRGISGGPHRMYIYLNNTVASRRVFGGGPESIVVHPRVRYTKLEIPTPTRCEEPVSIEQTPAGIRVRATCRDLGPGGNIFTSPVLLRNGASAERPEPDAPRAALVRGKAHEELLRAALALPPGEIAAENAAEATGGDGDERAANAGRTKGDPVSGVTAPSAEAGKALAGKGLEGPANIGSSAVAGGKGPAAATTAPQTDAPTAALAGTNESSSSPATESGKDGKSGSNVASTFFAVALLVGLGVVAAVFARRRVKGSRMIRIVETASIGPKRSLVVACIGGRTMVLGVSEAGVSLLDSQGVSPVVSEASTHSPGVNDANDLDAATVRRGQTHETDGSEQKNEGSLLSRLFPRSKPTSEDNHHSHDFEGLLSESLEDEELRRKLSLGEAGRVA
jgi:flagellar biogenesis protein FliO